MEKIEKLAIYIFSKSKIYIYIILMQHAFR